MTPLGTPRTHFFLTSGAAKLTGVDLVAAFREGRLTQAEWSDAVTRCRGCAEPGACAIWLRGPEPETDLPGYCRNAALFDALRDI
ncbi:DUF6455 family protein [Flavimaricola marinus]|uniref:DUF6455 domain-containing protein n=1 Tax=Flavimaricola marinus TaxID=1819565 RepID=A0A238LGD4_9RHOB|nr:DUF6455 family protein [Flavimaricola marinus]SMY08642.1 hypothetical protein LOM8899_02797 [Flavimaricola marinus]